MLCFLYRFSVVKTVRLQQWICVFLRFLVFLYKYFFFEESSNATNWNTIFRSDEHVFIWTTFISQFFRLLIYFKFWQFVSFLWAYIPSFKKKPIIFAWNKRPGFYLFHVKNHRMLGIINHQDEKLAAWILIPCAEKCIPPGLIFTFFGDICGLSTPRMCIFHINKIERTIFFYFKPKNRRIQENTSPRISKKLKIH